MICRGVSLPHFGRLRFGEIAPARRHWSLWGLTLAVALGCQRAPEMHYVESDAAQALDAPLRELVRTTLVEHTGTPAAPKLLGAAPAEQRQLEWGASIYLERCQHCHGVTGDGNGPAAGFLTPRPRDYRKGIFKFTSTPYGAKPRREDLLRTVRRGVIGTSMPSFNLLSEEELNAVVDYVLALTHRGELEIYLAAEAESEEELDPEVVTEYVDSILSAWSEASEQVVEPLSPPPARTPETVAQGKQLFMTKGCAKCHGEDGRGMTRDNVGVDAWGNSTRAADLTSGMLHGGTQPVDIYRRIYSGINGTPMPSFQSVFAAEPETFWYLVHYVLHVSSQRRQGNMPPFSRPMALAEMAVAGPSGPATEEPATEEPATEEPATEEPATEEPATEEPAAEEPAAEEPAAEEPAAEEPAAEEPAAEEPAAEEPAAEEPAAVTDDAQSPEASADDETESASDSEPPTSAADEASPTPANEPAAEQQP